MSASAPISDPATCLTPGCENTFPPNRPTHLYCSKTCRYTMKNIRARESRRGVQRNAPVRYRPDDMPPNPLVAARLEYLLSVQHQGRTTDALSVHAWKVGA
ncbi:MAG: hypothetical protein P8O03_03120 [Ilumatobacter sp.]|nr:hypothetical protein [Ilumatobacter sp.]